jgi:hypothetical protein
MDPRPVTDHNHERAVMTCTGFVFRTRPCGTHANSEAAAGAATVELNTASPAGMGRRGSGLSRLSPRRAARRSENSGLDTGPAVLQQN